MDSLDEELIKVLGANARQSAGAIAKHFKVSPSTVRRRTAYLIKQGVLRIIGVFDPVKVGYPLCAVMAFHVSSEHLDSVVDELASRPEVKWLVVTTGRYDIIALVYSTSFQALAGFIRKGLGPKAGLHEIETFICLENKKGHFVPLFFNDKAEHSP